MLECPRCGEEQPETNRFCGLCGRSLKEPSKVERGLQYFGIGVLALGSVILIIVTLVYGLGALQALWSTDIPGYVELYANTLFLTGDSYAWPRLTVGLVLCALGATINYLPRVSVTGRAGKVVKLTLVIGCLFLIISAFFGFFYQDAWRGLQALMTGGDHIVIIGVYTYIYLALVLAGLSFIAVGSLLTAWKNRV